VALPQEVLSELAYKNYRDVRAVALLFIILGSILFLGGISVAANPEQVQNGNSIIKHPAVCIGLAVAGLAGVIGGIATRLGSKSWAPVIKIMAWVYIWGFPIGTILSWSLLDGFSQYFKSLDRIRRAEEREDNGWDDEDDDDRDEDEEDFRPKKRRKRYEDDEEDERPKKHRKRREVDDEDDEDERPEKPWKRRD
jgi:hypothetical protein